MSLWEYKILTSGSLGFGSPSLLEQYLNQLGKEQWEIIAWQTTPGNSLIFQGLARRPILRDWFPETSEMTRAPRSVESPEEKSEPEGESPAAVEPKRDQDARVPAADHDEDLNEEDEDDDEALPTLFDALRPYLRRNKHGGGASVEVQFLAKKFEQDEGELLEAFNECGLPTPKSADERQDPVESDGWMYWLNRNQRGQIWVNAREKPKERPAPPPPQPKPVAQAQPAPEKFPEVAVPPPIPATGDGAILDKLRGMMRRNRRGYGYSGNLAYLARALQQEQDELMTILVGLGLQEPLQASDRPPAVEWNGHQYWLNKNQGGQMWLNGRPKRGGNEAAQGETASDEGGEETNSSEPTIQETAHPHTQSMTIAERAWRNPFDTPQKPEEVAAMFAVHREEAPAPEVTPVEAPVAASENVLASLRLLLKKKKTGTGLSGRVADLAENLGKNEAEVLTALEQAGLKLPETPKGKPTYAELAEEIFWLNQNPKGEVWLNAKEASKKKPAAKPKKRSINSGAKP